MTTLTTKEVIEMAKQAGMRLDKHNGGFVVKRFAKLVADKATAREREACAKFFDDNDTLMFWGSQAATHIRARGNT